MTLLSHAVPRTLAAALLLSLGGCTLVADSDSYRFDEGCDLDFRVIGFGSPHLGLTFTAQLDRPDDVTPGKLRTESLAMVDGIPVRPFTFHLPLAVRSEVDSQLDFFVDNDGQPGYTPTLPSGGRGDHSWTINRPCAEPVNSFTHVALFQDFVAQGTGRDLAFDLRGFAIGASSFEVRTIQIDPSVDAIDGDGTGAYTRAFLHVTTPAAETPIDLVDTRGHLVTLSIPQMLDDVGFTTELWIDRDGDQVVDDTSDPSTDEGYVFVFSDDPGANPGSLPLPGPEDPALPVVLDVTQAGTADHSGVVGVLVDAP